MRKDFFVGKKKHGLIPMNLGLSIRNGKYLHLIDTTKNGSILLPNVEPERMMPNLTS